MREATTSRALAGICSANQLDALGQVAHAVHVVEHEQRAVALGQLVDEPRQDDLAQRRDAARATPSAAATCAHSTAGSSSPSSSVTHTASGSRSVSRHAASSVDFPKPAGQATSVTRRLSSRRSNSRSRATVWAGTTGGWSLVTRRMRRP